MQSQPVSKSKKTEYDIFFQIVKEQENKLPLRRVKHKTADPGIPLAQPPCLSTPPTLALPLPGSANLVFHTSSTLNHPLPQPTPVDANRKVLVEVNGIEPMTPCLQSRCSPS